MFKDYTCPKCGYKWMPRTAEPKECPFCKCRLDRRRWKEEQAKKEN